MAQTTTITLPAEQYAALVALGIISVTEGDAPAVTEAPIRNRAGRLIDPVTKKWVKGDATPKGKAGKPARKAKKAAAQAKSSKFYEEVIVGGREARAARKSSNADMAKWMRDQGLQPRGTAWELAKHGERSVAVLAKAQRKDAKKAKKA